MAGNFRVALTGDFLTPDGRVGWGDIGLSELDRRAGVSYTFLDHCGSEISPEQLEGVDALIGLLPRVTVTSVKEARDLKVVARFGVGFDNVDLDACTRNGTLVTITRDAVRRPMAVATVSLLLAASHRLLEKDRLVRTDRWHDRLDFMGTGLTGKVVGFVGWGSIGGEITRLLAPFGLTQIAYDPYGDERGAAELGVQLTSLQDVLSRSDFLMVVAALTQETEGILGADEIGAMKASAFLVNVSRGPLVDHHAVATALSAGRLAGAALDVFRNEPLDPADPILTAPRTVLTPHAAGWTDELAWNTGRSAIASVLAVADGRVPPFVVNPGALAHPKLRGLRG